MKTKLKHESIHCKADESSAEQYYATRIVNGTVKEFDVMAYNRTDAEQTVEDYIAGKIEQSKDESEVLL